MAGDWIRPSGRGHQWHNGWDEDDHQVAARVDGLLGRSEQDN